MFLAQPRLHLRFDGLLLGGGGFGGIDKSMAVAIIVKILFSTATRHFALCRPFIKSHFHRVNAPFALQSIAGTTLIVDFLRDTITRSWIPSNLLILSHLLLSTARVVEYMQWAFSHFDPFQRLRWSLFTV